MQSYFGSISGDENITFLDQQVVGQDISRSLDAPAALPRITLSNSSSSLTTFRQQNSVQNVQLFGDEDVFICGKCKQQFFDLHMFIHHKKEGCMVNIAIPEQQQNCLPAIQLPAFHNASRAPELHTQSTGILLPSLSASVSDVRSINTAQSFGHHMEVAGLNLTQDSERDRAANSNPVRVAAQTSGIPVCGNPSATAPSSSLTMNMNDVSPLVQLQNSCGLLQGGVPLGARRVESIVIADDMMTNSSSPSPAFNTEPQMDRCFQDSDINPHHLSNFVNVLGGSGISPLLQNLPPVHTTYQQPLSSFNNTQPVYIHIPPPQQLETQTTYSILPKNPSMNYAVGLNLSSLQVAPLPMNTDATTNLCSTQESFFQPQIITVQESNVQNKEVYPAPEGAGIQTPDVIQSPSPIIAAKKKVVTKKVFTCQYCSKSFSKTFDLQQHVRSHTGEKPFQCLACGRAFAQKSNVRKHMEIHKVWPKEAMDVMPIMVVHSNHIPGMDQRKRTGSGGSGPLTYPKFPTATKFCPYCNFPLGTYNERKAHMLNHKDKQIYKCVKEDCGQTFADRDDFVEHAKTHIGSMKYNCHHCQEVFDSLFDIRKHQEQLDDESSLRHTVKHRCKLCPAKFARADLLQNHMTVETHKHFCPVCSKQFSCTSYLDHHMKKMHAGSPRKRYKCDVCGKFMNSIYYLQSHMLIHTKEKPFKCQICDARFNRKDKLGRHMVTHDPNKKYKCPFRETMSCMKEFNRPDKLKAHIISHNGIKAHQCSYCPKRFSRRNIKVAHEKTHSIQYSCPTCRKSFRNQSSLDTHKCVTPKAKQQQAASVGDDETAGKISSVLHNDLLNLREPEGPMYAYRSGSKRKHLRRNASRSVRGAGRRTESLKTNVEINITATVTVEETEVDIEGDT